MIDTYKNKLISKVQQYHGRYSCYRYITHDSIECKIYETKDSHFTVPDDSHDWKGIEKGATWGGEQVYGWIKGTYTVPAQLVGKELWLKSEASASEALYFLNGTPVGLFDYTPEVRNPHFRLHNIQPLTSDAKDGEQIDICIEGYAGQTSFGCMPFETIGNCDNFYPTNSIRTYEGMYVIEIDSLIDRFLYDINMTEQLYRCLPDNNFLKWKIPNVFEEMFKVVPFFPDEYPREIWQAGIEKSIELMRSILECKESEEQISQWGEVGLIGHSHLDTAWQWPVRETIHKAARTFSNALSVMERYPEYTFIQSSVLHLDWMKKYYPDIFKGIQKRTAEGRWEPNGGSWVECDGNITGSEYLIRHFVKGQRYLKENLNYTADSFWQPDTFGYSASIPQILKGCDISYFLTTKLSWNESNKFPYDSFVWKGIDGSEILTHFNITHCWPDAEAMLKNTQEIPHKDVSDMKLISYGFGDGGGGPSYSMLEASRRCRDLKCLPKSRHTTVSAFMNKLKSTARDLPVYDGELYLELHRGTLTQKHDIKRSNRKCEIALRNAELLNAHNNLLNKTERIDEINDLMDVLLLNQFHDILPGTSLQEVHELAIEQNYATYNRANQISDELLSAKASSDTITIYNPLSWEWNHQIVIDDNGIAPKGCRFQRFTNLKGEPQIAIQGISIPSLSSIVLETAPIADSNESSAFTFNGNVLNTPFAKVTFDEIGAISSFIHLRDNREVVKNAEQPLNTFFFGEDVPALWDNWDIDLDQKLKMKAVKSLLSREIVSDGALQLRIRSCYALGQHSTIRQDMIFYSDNERIDFETIVDWNDNHNLLKTSFNVDIRAKHAKHEIQFGHVERETTANNSIERSKFEVCNHKWTDLSESKFGVALLNDCKYGISVDDSDMRLTLHKGGCRPDMSGDVGVHEFVYSFLPHSGQFNANCVIRPAYELNIAPIAHENAETPLASLLNIDCANIIAETIKLAEDNDGIVVRLYEAECNKTNAVITFNPMIQSISEVNMLEIKTIRELPLTEHQSEITFKPFEIKTLKLKY